MKDADPGLKATTGLTEEDRRPGWMVRQMFTAEQRLSQGSQSSQQQVSSSQGVLSASQGSQQVSAEGEASVENPKTSAGWFVDQIEKTFNKEDDLNTKTTGRRKSFVYGKLSGETGEPGPAEPSLSLPLETEEASVQSADSDLPSSPPLLPVETGETGETVPAGPESPKPGPSGGFKAPSKAGKAKTAKADQSGRKVAAATKTKGSKKKKKEKDPNAPKRSKSSYLYFCEDVRAGLRQENPALSLTEMSKELGRRWKEMADKTKYEILAEEDRARYTEEKVEYEKTNPSPPKKAKTSFIFFCNELRGQVAQENPDMKVTDIGAELGRRWNAMTEGEKQKYQQMAAEDRKRYAQEKTTFVESQKTEATQAAKGKKEVKVTKKNVAKQKKVKEIPKKPKVKKSVKLSNDDEETQEPLSVEVENSDMNTEAGGADSSVLVEDLLDHVISNMTEKSVKPPAVKKKSVLPVAAKKSLLPVARKAVKRKTVEKTVVATASKKRKVAKKAKSPAELGSSLETKQALLRLQKLRVADTWAQCSIATCSKWRYLAGVKDPAKVKMRFTCRDCPDPRYDSCEAVQQSWDSSLDPHFVEINFTAGSLVWARLDGFPAWPAMVEDDPDTGSFFWTDEVDSKVASSYHVVFLEGEGVKVTRCWLSTSRLRRFDCVKPSTSNSGLGSRLLKAFSRAVQAAGESLEDRRENYSFAQLYQGPWGPVWPGCGEERMDLHLDDGDLSLSQNVLSLGDQDMSFTDKSFSCDVLGSISPVNTPVKPVLAKKSKPAPAEKENQPPPLALGNLYNDKSVFTQELSQPQEELLKISFTQDEDLSDSLTKEVTEAVQNSNLFTPIKRVGPLLPPVKSPAPQASYQTSTPVRPVKISQEIQKEEEETPANTSAPFDDSFLQ